MSPGLSVVIPFHNESESIPGLVEEVYAALASQPSFELICVDDGSSDDTFDQLRAVQAAHPGLRLLRHRERCGQSTAVRTGVKRAKAPWVVTLDGDGQNDPADIPRLLAVLEDPDRPSDVHLVIGMRKKRQDNLIKRVSSRIANGVRGRMLGDDTPDSGCGLKLFSRDAFLDLPYFDHMHRFLPALIQRRRACRVRARKSPLAGEGAIPLRRAGSSGGGNRRPSRNTLAEAARAAPHGRRLPWRELKQGGIPPGTLKKFKWPARCKNAPPCSGV